LDDGFGARSFGVAVSRPADFRSGSGLSRRRAQDTHGAQLVEFAVALPLLVVFVVGIFDFSGAFTLKQKLTNISLDAARTAAADPANDLSASVPVSVYDVYYLIDNYLVANKINDCALGAPTASGSPLTWQMTGTGNGCPSTGLTVIVNRGYYFPANVDTQNAGLSCAGQTPGAQIAVVSTCVSIQYPYQWRFGKVASLLGRATTLPTTISAAGVAMNEN
jgi:Flp pilus assembly protein TadG